MGAAWRGPSQVGARQWERVLDMVRRIRALDMEVCTTLGMLNEDQAQQLRQAGLTAYNHNLDTSPEFYGQITTTRKYEVCDRCGASGGMTPRCEGEGVLLTPHQPLSRDSLLSYPVGITLAFAPHALVSLHAHLWVDMCMSI